VESILRRLKIHSFKAQVVLRKLVCESLATEFLTALSFEQRALLARKWDETLKERYVLQFMIDLLERQEREHSSDQPRPNPARPNEKPPAGSLL
jgi:hypothetical protein